MPQAKRLNIESRIAIHTLTKKLPLIFRAERCIRTSGKVIYFSQLWCSFYRTCCALANQLKCPALVIALKQLNCILPQSKSTQNLVHFPTKNSLTDCSQTTSVYYRKHFVHSALHSTVIAVKSRSR